MKTHKSPIHFARYIGLAALLVICAPGLSHAWDKAYTCDNDTLVVDSEPNPQGSHAVFGQMVLRGNLARWLFQDVGAADRSDFNQRGEIVVPTNYDERGNLSLAAFLPDNTNRHDLCLRFRPNQNLVLVMQTRDSYCNAGKVIGSYQFKSCRSVWQ